MKIRRVLQILGLIVMAGSWYVASYLIWRGPAVKDKCDVPYSVVLSDGPSRMFFAPLIVIDRSINEFSTDIVVE